MRIAMATLAIIGFACSTVEEPGSSGSGLTASGALPEYFHAFNRSHFAIGGSTTLKSEFGMQKVIGPWGVFSVRDNTNMVLALPNADAPSRARPPCPGGPAAHDAAVKGYFIGAGLPEDQIDKIQIMTSVTGSGPEPAGGQPLQVAAYYSSISRQYQGIPVVDSYAWAKINDDSEVVIESVYWPEIPSSTLAQAASFAKKLVDPSWSEAFVAKLPKKNGQLVIHHTPGVWKGQFEARVAYDTPWSGGRKLHFDENGVAFDLAEEKPGAWGTAPGDSK